VGRTFPDAAKGCGGCSGQSVCPIGEPCAGLPGRVRSWHQPPAAATAAAPAAATATTGSSLVGFVHRADPLRGGPSSAATGRFQLAAEPNGSRGPPATLSLAPRPGPSSILALSHGHRAKIFDAGRAIALAVQKGHAIAHGQSQQRGPGPFALVVVGSRVASLEKYPIARIEELCSNFPLRRCAPRAGASPSKTRDTGVVPSAIPRGGTTKSKRRDYRLVGAKGSAKWVSRVRRLASRFLSSGSSFCFGQTTKTRLER